MTQINSATPTPKPKVGREFQHLEDLVFAEGSAGATRAVDILEQLGTDASEMAVKWDGNPTMYWGREPNGTFVMTGKNGWGRNLSTSADNLVEFILNTGKGEAWRAEFADSMAVLFPLMEAATPADFRGYVYGDLLWHPTKSFDATATALHFTPNKVTYTVDRLSPFGQRIQHSVVGVAAHCMFETFGSKENMDIETVDQFNSEQVVVVGQTCVAGCVSIDRAHLQQLRSVIQQHGTDIDAFLSPKPGLSDLPNIIYTYVNSMSKTNQLHNLSGEFLSWLSQSKVSVNKQAKIAGMVTHNNRPLLTTLDLVSNIMTAKNDVIDQVDHNRIAITEHTAGQPGGEGYVLVKHKIKLVPRHKWKPN